MSRVFRKTALGIETFARQDGSLSHAHRALLVLIDGKRNASQLRKFGASFGNVNALIAELYNTGLIELDPAYIQKMAAIQKEISADMAQLPSALVVETVVAGQAQRATADPISIASSYGPSTRSGPVTRSGPPTVSSNAKRDLRELAMLGEPDPVTRSALTGLTLTPLESGAQSVAPNVTEQTLSDAKKTAVRLVFEALGNSGTPLCFAFDKTDSAKRLLEVVEIAASTLRDMKGAAVAAEFRRAINEVLAR